MKNAGTRVVPAPPASGKLPRLERVLAVCAHPDDESFGLGAVLAALADAGTSSNMLCLTHGEASTLGPGTGDLRRIRVGELAAAAAVLGMAGTTLLDYPDGRLAAVPAATLAAHVHQHLQLACLDALLVFDEGGITGHPDHCQATAAALTAADRLGLTVIAWAIPDRVAEALNAEFGTAFAGRPPEQIDLAVTVDRAAQLKAIACHASQSADNPVLWRRLELLGDAEHLRYLRRRTGGRKGGARMTAPQPSSAGLRPRRTS
jgi:LmbE family N-acetylglucosaminyl deacetylase